MVYIVSKTSLCDIVSNRFPSELNNDTQCNMIEALIYKMYQRRIYHAYIMLHPSHYLITTQNQSFIQIVYLV